jgi:(p)ppGpp synthase/HD superfamily hydrolase
MSSPASIQTDRSTGLSKTWERITCLLPWPALAREALRDWLFLVTHPISYQRLARALGRRRDEEHKLNGMVAWLRRRLAEAGIEAQVCGRLKRFSSIHRKMRRRGVPLHAVYDLRGVRIIVDREETCYRVLEFVHRWCEPIPGQFDDYVVFPKRNGYQSLHTVVRARGGLLFELQIRSQAMHRVAELGSAAHWRYKGRPDSRPAARPSPLPGSFGPTLTAPIKVPLRDRD